MPVELAENSTKIFGAPESLDARELFEVAESAAVTFGQRLQSTASAFGLYNPVTSSVTSDSVWNILDDYDATYDPQSDMVGYEDYADILATAKHPEHMANLKSDIDRQNKYSRDIQNGGALGIVSALAAGILDPLALVAFGSAGKITTGARQIKQLTKGQKAAQIGLSGAKTGAGTAAGVAATELVLQATQPNLTAEESIKAIAAGTLLGGVLGGAGKALSVDEYTVLSKQFKNDFTKITGTPKRIAELDNINVKEFNSSVGAAQVKKLTIEDLTLVDTFGFARISKFLNPTLRVMQSSSLRARQVYSAMAESPYRLQGAQDGKAMPVAAETFAKLYDAKLGNAVKAEQLGWKEYKALAKNKEAPSITRAEYRKRISQALRRGDADIEGNGVISRAAQAIRKDFLNEMKDAAVRAGVFPEDIEAKFAETYLTRMWNPHAITRNIQGFQQKLRPWAEAQITKQMESIEKLHSNKVGRYNKRIEKEEAFIDSNNAKIQAAESKDPVKFDYKNLASVRDDYLESIKREIGLQELGAYLSRFGLEDISSLVNSALITIPKMPKSLAGEIVSRGGIKPDDWLATQNITNKARVGLISNKGLPLDKMMRELVDDGYFPEYRGVSNDLPEDFGVDDLRQAIQEDLYGSGVFKDSDIDLVTDIDIRKAMQEEAIEILNNLGFADYRSFYKEIYDDIKNSKKSLKKGAKEERIRLRGASQGAREALKDTKVFRDELKKFRNAEVATLRRNSKKAETRIAKLKAASDEFTIKRNSSIAAFKNANDDGISEAVDDVVDGITANLSQLKSTPDVPPYVSPSAIGSVKEKLLSVDDVDFEEFLENDIRQIMDYYRHNIGTQVELKNTIGSIDLKDELQEVADEYLELVKNAPDKKTADKLRKEGQNVVRDIKGVRDIMLGNYNKHHDPDSMLNQAGVVIRDLQFMAKMGGVTISSIPDMARSVMVNGFENTLEAGAMRTLSKEVRKMTMEELEESGLMLEAVLASRLQSLAEIGDPLNRGTALTRFTGNSANVFSKFTLINQWNDIQKSIAAMASQQKLRKALNAGDNNQFIRDLGIDERMGKIMQEQIKKHGNDKIVGIKDWDIENPDVYQASRLWRAALRKEADIAVVTRGAGDLPLLGNHPLGRVWLQFRTFLIASHGRVFLRALQSNNKEAGSAIMGAVMMVSLGMGVAAIKAEMAMRSAGLRGSDTNYDTSEWNKRKWLIEGVDRSGLIAMIMEPLNLSDKAMGLGPSLLTGQGSSSRFGSRNAVGAFLGPSAGTMSDVLITGRAAVSPITGNDVRKSDIYAARKVLPFQNAFIFRQMFDILENKTGEALGAQ